MPRSPVTGRPRPSAARRPNLLIEQDVICVEFKCECECECSPRSRCASRTAEGMEEGAQTSSHPGRIGWVCRSSARTAGGMMTCWKSSPKFRSSRRPALCLCGFPGGGRVFSALHLPGSGGACRRGGGEDSVARGQFQAEVDEQFGDVALGARDGSDRQFGLRFAPAYGDGDVHAFDRADFGRARLSLG